jgi:hypothetical protein
LMHLNGIYLLGLYTHLYHHCSGLGCWRLL